MGSVIADYSILTSESNPTFLLLAFQLLAHQDEIARLKKLEEAQSKAYFDKIAGKKK